MTQTPCIGLSEDLESVVYRKLMVMTYLLKRKHLMTSHYTTLQLWLVAK